MYKFHYQFLSSVFDTFFNPVRNIHRYNTRLFSRMTYAIPKVRTNYGIFNIRFQGAKVRNDISDDIKLLSLKRFKKKLKLILIDKYLLQIYQHYISSGFLLFNTGILSFLLLSFFLFLLAFFFFL